ncbi:Duplicated homeodomain-like superfamily protein [Euphorbia peplus]|nr:Duplicated homeodomain-like superfamily protein [Euphorbia peplus]
MPPERFPWDRKDFRKYDRSTPHRWRDSSSSSHHYGSSRWGGGSNEFRRPPGHGKQGSWHMFAEESGHGYAPFRSSDRMLDDKNFRSTVSRGDGKYGRNSRDNRVSFGQRDWRGDSWDLSNGSPNTPGRLLDVSNDQRSVDDMLTYPSSHSQPEYSSSWDQLQSKEQHDNNKLAGANGLEASQRGDRETSLDWKPLKWARSISLSSRGSGFSHSSSSKSLGGGDSTERKAELCAKTASLVTSPSGEAATCVTSALSEEMSARKKPRLKWGEGLAKFEKKKVDGPEVNVDKDGADISCSNNEMHSDCLNMTNKSPRLLGFSECASPATPSSVACSSPGLEEKSFGKPVNVDNDVNNLCGSPSAGSQSHTESFSFNLEVLEGTSITNLLVELLQYDDSSVDSSFMRSTAMNKLLVLKDNLSKTLEVTESEIDSLENELESLKFESGSGCPCPAVSSSLPMEGNPQLHREQAADFNSMARPSPLEVLSCGAENVEKVDNLPDVHCGIKDDDVDSPGTATSKFVESVSIAKKVSSPHDPGKFDEHSGGKDVVHFPTVVSNCSMPCTNEEGIGASACRDVDMPIERKEGGTVSSDLSYAEDNLCNLILAANKESACRASEVFSNVLPKDLRKVNFSEVCSVASWKSDSIVRAQFASRKRLKKFKERVVTLKFKALNHLWKEDIRLLSIRKHRAKSQKKFESNLRTTQCVVQKNRSSIRLRFSSPVENLSLVPSTEMLNFTRKLLSECQVKHYRNDLKMPALILDKKERRNSQFISNNGLVEDPWAVEKERAMINPWTSEEREIFIDKLGSFGKDFQTIATFLDHKTTADCVEFYYKNHKSDCFEKTKKSKPVKSSTTYLMASSKNWKREMNAASLDVLGTASCIAADAEEGLEKQQMRAGRVYLSGHYDSKMSCHDEKLDQSSDFDMLESERETAAADVLAGICGSMSSEAMGSCITTSLDPGESCWDRKSQRVNSVKKRPSLSDVSQNADEETCSDESCGEMDPSDWTDEEKAVFIRAVSSHGKDFAMISQCVGTRSRDQCKVFFSKVRKCLGLDSIHAGLGNSDDLDGGGSDTEDGCAMETSSVMCSDKLGSDLVEDLDMPVTVTKHEESDALDMKTLTSDLNRSEDYDAVRVPDQDESKDEKTCVSDSCVTENKQSSRFDHGFNNHSEFVHAQETSNESVSSDAKRGKSIDDNISAGRAVSVSETVGYCSSSSGSGRVKTEVCANGSRDCLEGKKPLFLQDSLNGQLRDSDATKELPLHPHSNFSPVVSSVPEDQLAINSVLHASSALPCDNRNGLLSSQLLSLESGDIGKNSVCADDHLQLLPAQSSTNCSVSSQILRGYPLEILTKQETNGDISCGSASEVKGDHSVSGKNGTNQFLSQDFSLQKCSTSKVLQCSVPELPFLSPHCNNQVNGHSPNSSDLLKPSSSGDVKLFGRILSKPSSLQKPNPFDNVERGVHCAKSGSKSLNLKVGGHQTPEGSNSILKFDHNNFRSLENVPVKSYGFWDGSKIQTGFSSIPDYFLSKYPEAFSNYHRSSSKMEQQSLRPASGMMCSDTNLSNVSVLSAGEISGSNGLVDYQMYRGHDSSNKVQAYPVEVKQRQEIFSEIHRNGFEAIPNLQQQGRGMVGMNVGGRGGILVGGSCPAVVSDPVAALKMHFAKTEQYGGGQNGSIIREEESWRSRGGDLGR